MHNIKATVNAVAFLFLIKKKFILKNDKKITALLKVRSIILIILANYFLPNCGNTDSLPAMRRPACEYTPNLLRVSTMSKLRIVN